MRTKHVLAAAVAILAVAAAPAAAKDKPPTPPAGAIGNVEFVANLPEMKAATAINFLQYRHRDVMVATGRFGLRTYDLSNPRKPKFLDSSTTRRCACRAIRRSTWTTPTARSRRTGRTRTWTSTPIASWCSWHVIHARSRGRPRATTHRGRLHRRRAQPAQPAADRVPPAPDRPHDDVHQRLRLPLDRRPGIDGRPEGVAGLGRGPADHRHRHPQPQAAGDGAARGRSLP